MKQSYWKQYYVLETDADEIERHLQRTTFPSGGKQFELIYFEEGKNAPTILISQGVGRSCVCLRRAGLSDASEGI